MSLSDTLELMQNKDCMCLALQISRSEATIQDPTKLIIQGIVPTFMGLDSFLDASIYNLQKNQDASGGFDYKLQGELALGIGREKVSGVLPLFLFQDHWEIVKCKLQPLFGFMCTLDPMGYTVGQLNTIPFLVLNRAIEDVAQDPTESKKRILSLVLETCVKLVEQNEALRRQTIESANLFNLQPVGRTADVVPSINVMVAQLIALRELPSES